jgi:hypothetical protein
MLYSLFGQYAAIRSKIIQYFGRPGEYSLAVKAANSSCGTWNSLDILKFLPPPVRLN